MRASAATSSTNSVCRWLAIHPVPPSSKVSTFGRSTEPTEGSAVPARRRTVALRIHLPEDHVVRAGQLGDGVGDLLQEGLEVELLRDRPVDVGERAKTALARVDGGLGSPTLVHGVIELHGQLRQLVSRRHGDRRTVPASRSRAPSISVRTDRFIRRLMSHAATSAARVTIPRPTRLRRSPAVAGA